MAVRIHFFFLVLFVSLPAREPDLCMKIGYSGPIPRTVVDMKGRKCDIKKERNIKIEKVMYTQVVHLQ